MAFENLPDLGPMLLPGSAEYGRDMLQRAEAATLMVRHELDVPYGDDRFQRLDIWRPAGTARVPIVVLIHGGMFRNGHKEWMGAHAEFVTGLPAALVSINYRLVPRVRAPDCVEDCYEALSWIHRNAEKFGGDPNKLRLGGHSVGGHVAALMALDRPRLARHGIPAGAIAACLPISAPFTFALGDLSKEGFLRRMHQDLFAAEADAEAMSAYAHLAGNKVPFFVAWGERDVAELLPDNVRLVRAAGEGGFLTGTHIVPGADHFTAHVACLNPDGPWNRALRESLR